MAVFAVLFKEENRGGGERAADSSTWRAAPAVDVPQRAHQSASSSRSVLISSLVTIPPAVGKGTNSVKRQRPAREFRDHFADGLLVKTRAFLGRLQHVIVDVERGAHSSDVIASSIKRKNTETI